MQVDCKASYRKAVPALLAAQTWPCCTRRKKKAKRNKQKTPLLVISHPSGCNLHTLVRAQQDSPGEVSSALGNRLAQLRVRSSWAPHALTSAGRVRRGQVPLSPLCSAFSLELVLPGALGSSRWTQRTKYTPCGPWLSWSPVSTSA